MEIVLIILLLIALVIAIIFDTIRISQYVSYRKALDKALIELEIRRINSAYDQYQEDEPPVSFGEYLLDWMKDYRKKQTNILNDINSKRYGR